MQLLIQKCSEGTVAVDDTILVKGMTATAGSRMLEKYVPLFDAEVVSKLKNAGYQIAGKSNVGEFGIDLVGETSYFGCTTDDSGALCGAGAKLVADGMVECTINVDVNGFPRRAAALSGVTFIKPTYGTVSRYGVIPCACSGEQVGVTAKDAATAAKFLTVISGHDSKDGTSLPEQSYQYQCNDSVSGLKFALPIQFLRSISPDTAADLNAVRKALTAQGAVITEIDVPELLLAQPAWQILSAAEICNNLSRYDGVKFGYRTPNYKNIDELYTNSRSEAMGILAKFNILYGSDVLSKDKYDVCYDKAMRIRRIIHEKTAEIFKSYSCMLLPICSQPVFAPADVEDPFRTVYRESLFTSLANITGIPALSARGYQILSSYNCENVLFTVAATLERGTK